MTLQGKGFFTFIIPETEGGNPAAIVAAAQAAAPSQATAPQQSAPVAKPQAQSVTVKNPFMLLPSNVNFQASQGKTPLERNYGMSLFWDILAGEPQVDPTARLIAQALSRNGQG